MMSWCRFINCNKCATLAGMWVIGVGAGGK